MSVYLYLDFCLLLSELALALRRRSSAQTVKKDAGSLRLLWIVISLAMTAGHYVAGHAFAPRLPVFWIVGGVSSFIFGTTLRWWSIVHLGRFFTVDVAVAEDHTVVDTGPYRWMRHPSYTGLLLQFLGIGLCLLNLWSVFIIFLPPWLALRHRIRIEEDALLQQLGAPYRDYCARTGRLLPFR